VVWIPAAAVAAAAACVMLVLAFAMPTQTPYGTGTVADQEIQIRGYETGELPTWGSAIVAVDFGNGNGFTTSVTNEHGEALGVVWINE
jgi:hypothetical protein